MIENKKSSTGFLIPSRKYKNDISLTPFFLIWLHFIITQLIIFFNHIFYINKSKMLENILLLLILCLFFNDAEIFRIARLLVLPKLLHMLIHAVINVGVAL